MDAISILIGYAALEPILNLEDIATLLCVSKDVRNIVVHNNLHHDSNPIVIIATARSLNCIKTTHLLEDHYINLPVLLCLMLQIRRLYGNLKRSKELYDVLEVLTGQTAKRILKKEVQNVTKQEVTLHCLLDLFHNDCTCHNTIIMYVFMNFVRKVVSSSLPRKTNAICADRQFRMVIFDRCTNNIRLIREQVTCFPFGFMEKVIRQCSETRRYLSFYE